MEDRQKLNDLLPLLDTLSKQHPDESVREMATDLRIAIATHGHVLSDALKDASQQKIKATRKVKESEEIKLEKTVPENKEIKSNKKKKPLIEVISREESPLLQRDDRSEITDTSSNLQAKPVQTPTEMTESRERHRDSNTADTVKESKEKSELDAAFKELMDPLSKSEQMYKNS